MHTAVYHLWGLEIGVSPCTQVVNGATAMAEHVFLGRALLPRHAPSGGRADRAGSWTPPDPTRAVEAMLQIWAEPPTLVERNRVRVALQGTFAPWQVGQQMMQLLQPLKSPARAAASSPHVFCGAEFGRAERCWGPAAPVPCLEVEELRRCQRAQWQQPALADGVEAVHRLIPHLGMLYNVHDVGIGRHLELCGEWLRRETAIYRHLPKESRVVEAGAHIGALTIPLARHLSAGRVLALEPSRLNLQLLHANLALAQLTHVDTFQAVLGEAPSTLYTQESPTSFRDFRHLELRESGSRVQVVTLDQLLGQVDRLDLVRLTHVKALRGGIRSLERFRPWLLVESNEEPELRKLLRPHGYDCGSAPHG